MQAVNFTDDVRPLIRLAQAGDERAWAELVDRFGPMLWSIARGYRLSPEDAADAVQVTWLRLLEHIGELREPQLVGAWLATTVRRQCLGVLASRDRTPLRAFHDVLADGRLHPPTDGATVDEALLREERDQILYAALSRLPARQQLLLRLLSSSPAPSYREISAATGIPIGSIGPTRARALQRLRDILMRQELLAS